MIQVYCENTDSLPHQSLHLPLPKEAEEQEGDEVDKAAAAFPECRHGTLYPG